MSLDLIDLRIKITPETAAWLEAESRLTGKPKQEILRDLAHSIALEKISGANLLAALAPREGHGGATGGKA